MNIVRKLPSHFFFLYNVVTFNVPSRANFSIRSMLNISEFIRVYLHYFRDLDAKFHKMRNLAPTYDLVSVWATRCPKKVTLEFNIIFIFIF